MAGPAGDEPRLSDPASVSLPSPPARPRRLVYLGTPDVAVAPLRALHQAGFDIALVITRPDRRRGRGGALSPSPVKAAALELGLPVTDDLDALLEVDVDLGVVVAYGRIIPRRVLDAVPMVNLHFSLLPRWRGAAPVERALLAGDEVTGVCVMEVAEGLDTGAVYAVEETAITAEDTLDGLRGRLVEIGGRLLVGVLVDGLPVPVAQEGEITMAAKIDPAELEIDWSRAAVEIGRLVRLGGAWTTFRGKRLKVWRADLPDDESGEATGGAESTEPGTIAGLTVATGDGILRLIEVQPEGKARQQADSWRNGSRPLDTERFGA